MSDTYDWNQIDKSWAEASGADKSTDADYLPIPDGPYTCVIDRVEFRTSKSGNEYLNWVLVVDSGPHEGRWLFKRNMLANAQNMAFLKKDIASCGAPVPEKLSDLDLESLLDRKVKITKKTKGDFENIYIDHQISEVKGDTRVMKSAETKVSSPTEEIKDDQLPY